MTKDELSARECVGWIAEAVERIQSYTSELNEKRFLESRITQDAVIRNLQVIGEAFNILTRESPQFVARHPELPVRAGQGMRNVLAHGYFELLAVWRTVSDDLPRLRRKIESLP
jgi:uncharacterized protein with HEPN domain